MSLTLFGLLWVPVNLLYSLKPIRLLQLGIVGSIFQGAAIALQGKSDGLALVPSLLPALLFLGHGVMQRLTGRPTPTDRHVLGLLVPLFLFLAYAVLTAHYLPMLLEYRVQVWPVRPPTTALGAQWLTPTRGNITQTFYILVRVALVTLAALYLAARPHLQALLVRTYIASGFVVIAICFWELASFLAGVPYPDEFLHSNRSYALLSGEVMGGVSRVAGPFTEPSELAMFLSGTLLCSTFLILRGQRGWAILLLGLGSLLMILLSTSTTGFVSVLIMLLLILLMPLMGARLPGVRRIGIGVGIGILVTLACCATLPSVAPRTWESIQNVIDATLHKQHSESYDERTRQNADSVMLLPRTYGLGAGWGSVRASSLIATMAGNVGLPGLLLFGWLVFSLTRQVGQAHHQALPMERRFVIDGTTGALLGNLIAASVAVPEIDPVAFYVLLATLIACLAGIQAERRAFWRRMAVRAGSFSRQPLSTMSQSVDGRSTVASPVAHSFGGRLRQFPGWGRRA